MNCFPSWLCSEVDILKSFTDFFPCELLTHGQKTSLLTGHFQDRGVELS